MRMYALIIFALPALPICVQAQTSPRSSPPATTTAPSAPNMEFSEELRANLRGLAIDLGFSQQGRVSVVTITVRQPDFDTIMPMLQRRGIMNPDVTQTTRNTRRFTLASVYAVQMTTTVISEIYERNASADRINFVVSVAFPDDYGKNTSERMFTFTFNRQINSKIDWDNFRAANLQRVSQDFRYTPFINRKFQEESIMERMR